MLKCNVCRSSVDGIAFKSSCQHFFCPNCASVAFTAGRSCPVCSSILRKQDVAEITIGINPSNCAETIFQNAVYDTNWSKMLENTNFVNLCCTEMNNFVTHQLHFENMLLRKEIEGIFTKEQEMSEKIDATFRDFQQRTNVIESRLREAELALATKDQELSDLKTAYKEKMRKCQAWEKAYNNLRLQLQGGDQLSVLNSSLQSSDQQPPQLSEAFNFQNQPAQSILRTDTMTYSRIPKSLVPDAIKSLENLPQQQIPSSNWRKTNSMISLPQQPPAPPQQQQHLQPSMSYQKDQSASFSPYRPQVPSSQYYYSPNRSMIDPTSSSSSSSSQFPLSRMNFLRDGKEFIENQSFPSVGYRSRAHSRNTSPVAELNSSFFDES